MEKLDSALVLETISNAPSYDALVSAFQSLKNDIVGHDLKKEKWVQLGILRLIVRLLAYRRPQLRRADTRHSRSRSTALPANELSQDETIQLLALEVLGIFCSGGPSFLLPLHAADAVAHILSYIDPNTTHPRIVYIALRSFATLAQSAQRAAFPPGQPPISTDMLADALCSSTHAVALCNILTAPSGLWWAESTANTAASLIGLLCCEERHQVVLSRAGVLDALTVKVASYVVAQGQVVPGADLAAEKDGLRDAIPPPASPRMDFGAVMTALSAIVGNSRLRAGAVLYASPVLAIFPKLEFESAVNDIQAAWKALSMGGLTLVQAPSLGAFDYLLPVTPLQQARPSLFPPLGTSVSHNSLAAMGRIGLGGMGSGLGNNGSKRASLDDVEGDKESPMIPWLISLARTATGTERLAAIAIVSALYRAGFASKSREAAMSLLIVPLVLQALEGADASGIANGASGRHTRSAASAAAAKAKAKGATAGVDDSAIAQQQALTELALVVFARLVANNEVLQKAAANCHAVRILAKLLKESYEPVVCSKTARFWSPTPSGAGSTGATATASPPAGTPALPGMSEGEAATQLGAPGVPSLLAYRIRLREKVLKALTALFATKYEYQKSFVNEDAMPYVVASLYPAPSNPRATRDKAKGVKEMEAVAAAASTASADVQDEPVSPEYGSNPASVLVAACNCVRMLSRSIALLRTTLEDAGVAAPIFRLLWWPDMEVQVAATGVVCNLVTETSPMRQCYTDAGIMKILCQHAHSQHAPLRLNALWALKHFVHDVTPEMKKACLEQLGTGWLVQLIDPDTDSESAAHFARMKSDQEAAAARDDDRMDDDVDMEQGDGGPDEREEEEREDNDEEEEEEADQEEDREGADDEADDDAEGVQGQVRRDQLAAAAAAASATRGMSTVSAGKMPWTGSETPTATATSAAATGSPSPPSSFYRATFPQMSHERSHTGRLRQADAKLMALKDDELNMARRAHSDDIVIQEQGLNFIRNLVGPCAPRTAPAVAAAAMALGSPPTLADRTTVAVAATGGAVGIANLIATRMANDTETDASGMIDYLFCQIGQDRLFQILLSKLKLKVLNPFERRTASGRRSTRAAEGGGRGPATAAGATATTTAPMSRVLHPQVKIIEAVIFILVHISASEPRHRQLVVAQTELMRALAGLFGHYDKGVRVALCHLMANLTWRDDSRDLRAAQARADELKRLGILGKLQAMQKEDPDEDVREQAKRAVDQINPPNF